MIKRLSILTGTGRGWLRRNSREAHEGSSLIWLVGILSVGLVACSNFQQSATRTAAVLEDYKVLSTPKSDIRIGAVWRPGIGPDGSGLSGEELLVSKSIDSLTADKIFRQRVEASVYQLLGVSGELRRLSSLELENIEVVTVADLSQLKVQPGNQLLYEAVRVGGIKIKTSQVYADDIRSMAMQRLGNSTIAMEGGGSGALSVSGANIYVAYRVVELGAAQVSVKRKRFTSARKQSLAGYEFSFDTKPVMNCICKGRPIGYQAGNGEVNRCHAQNSIVVMVENSAGGLVASGGNTMKFGYNLGAVTQPSIVIDNRNRANAIEIDRFSLDAHLSGINSCLVLGGFEFHENSVMTVQTIKYPIRPIGSPSAPSW